MKKCSSKISRLIDLNENLIYQKCVTLKDTTILSQAVGLVLGVIAAKLAAETFDIEILTPIQSLVVVVGILGAAVGLSLSSPPVGEGGAEEIKEAN